MKIIITRKGGDSKYGGCSSPIIKGQPISLPIPIPPSNHKYDDISFLNSTRTGYKVSTIASDLRGWSAERGYTENHSTFNLLHIFELKRPALKKLIQPFFLHSFCLNLATLMALAIAPLTPCSIQQAPY